MCNFISVNQTPEGMVWLRSSGRVHDIELCLPATLLWAIPARLFARGAGTVSLFQWLVLLSCPRCDQAGSIVTCCSCLWWERGTCHVCVWPQAPLVLQPTPDLGGRQQTLSGKELMVCAVTTFSLLRHPWAKNGRCPLSSLRVGGNRNQWKC